jgi:hypothetical protein
MLIFITESFKTNKQQKNKREVKQGETVSSFNFGAERALLW